MFVSLMISAATTAAPPAQTNRQATLAPSSASNAPPKALTDTRAADARIQKAKAAEARAKAAQEKLEKQRQQQLLEQQANRREEARLAALPTTTPVDPDAPEKDWLGYHHLTGEMSVSDSGVTLSNHDAFDWTRVQLRVNGSFDGCGVTVAQIKSGQSAFVPFSDLAKSGGERFSPLTLKVTQGIVFCKTRYGTGTCMFQF